MNAKNKTACSTQHRPRLLTILLGVTVALMAFNLRIPMASIGPLLPEAIKSTGLSSEGASFLTALPTICFGLFGPIGPTLARRFGIERVLLAALVVIAAGTVARGSATAEGLFSGQILACLGIAVVNVLLPGLVKRDFPRRVAFITGIYVMALCAGAGAAAAFTVPLYTYFGAHWAKALAAWAVPAVVATLLWFPFAIRSAHNLSLRSLRVRGLWKDALAWQLTLFMGLQSALAYIGFGWLAPMFRDRGLDATTAGWVLSINIFGQAISSLLAPSLATRGRDQRLINFLSASLAVAAFLACFYGSIHWAWMWSGLLGLAQGALFSVGLTMIALRAANVEVAGSLSSMTQTIGYLIASGGPFLAGIFRGLTGSWDGVAALVGIVGLVLAACGVGAGRAILVRVHSGAAA